MKQKLMIVIYVGLVMSGLDGGAAPLACKVRPWRGQPNVSLRTIKMKFDRMPRSEVIQTAWGEMLKPHQNTSVAMPALQYLAGTEQKKAVRGYYKAMSIAMSKGQLPSQNIKKWPTRAPASKSRYSLKQLCSLYAQAGAR